MKLFVITSDIQPSIFVKAETPEEAMTKFATRTWLNRPTFEKYIDHPSFRVRPVTMALLMDITPEEFQINEDTSF
jgi:hypothetical protein